MRGVVRTKHDFLKSILYILLLMPFFEPAYVSLQMPSLDTFYKIHLFISGVIILFLFLTKMKFSKMIIFILLYFLILCISTIINNGHVLLTVYQLFSIGGLCFLVEYGVYHDAKIFFWSFRSLMLLLLGINFFTILLYPHGMYINQHGFGYNWFLGYKNLHILYIFIAILINFIYKYMIHKKFSFSDFLLFAISILSTILVNNSTGLVGLSIVIILLLYTRITHSNFFTIKNCFLIYIIMFFAIVIFRVQDWFSFIIVDLLHKDLTFTGRTYIWDAVLQLIHQKVLLGYGNIQFQYTATVATTHNTILDVLYKTGLCGIFFYVMILLQVIKKLSFYKGKSLFKVLSIILFAYFIMMLTESYGVEYYLFIFVILYNIDKIMGTLQEVDVND